MWSPPDGHRLIVRCFAERIQVFLLLRLLQLTGMLSNQGEIPDMPPPDRSTTGRHTASVPTEHESELAHESSRRLSPFASRDIKIRIEVPNGPEVELPASAVNLLIRLLGQMAEGNAVALMPIQSELTTQQAAQFLGVSRPFLVKLLDERRIPYRLVGSHRRILMTHLQHFKEEMDARRHEILDELGRQAQQLGMGY